MPPRRPPPKRQLGLDTGPEAFALVHPRSPQRPNRPERLLPVSERQHALDIDRTPRFSAPARRTREEPKFALGDRVERDDGSARGEVSHGPQWDELAGWKWKVAQDGGPRHWWNESSMVPEQEDGREEGFDHAEVRSEGWNLAGDLMYVLQDRAESVAQLESLIEGATDRLRAALEAASDDARHGQRYAKPVRRDAEIARHRYTTATRRHPR